MNEMLLEKALDRFNREHRDRFEAVGIKYGRMGTQYGRYTKYFLNQECWLRWAVSWYEMLFNRPAMRHLDIGCGMGWLGYVAALMGHTVELADIPPVGRYAVSSEGYREGLEALGLKRQHTFFILPLKSMPIPSDELFDAISATGVAFHRDWDESAWQFFLSDVTKHLRPHGRILLQVNNDGRVGTGYDTFRCVADGMKAEWKDEKTCLLQKEVVET